MDVILGGFPTQELEKNTDEKNNEVEYESDSHRQETIQNSENFKQLDIDLNNTASSSSNPFFRSISI